ncbi:MAG: ferredoxin-thioredoxin reductase catalytic domain-containing protein [Desulfovibrionaceae bacterium]|nr:ferredoxin-thioredoxin reductase catalytic domain-containing protein [Desulfovibrionaceae bacterium]
MDSLRLYDTLKNIQEPKGYYFNKDTDMTMALLEGLVVNRERLGYMACPCRLANGEYDQDKDIICPCAYREADVKEFGSCFCGLYVSKDWNEGKIEQRLVPERRPPENIRS